MASTTPEKPPATAEKPPHRRETGPGIIIARPFGIPVFISPYWFVIAGVFILIYANDLAATLHGSTRFIVAAAFVVLLYVSVLIHELSHSLVARSYGLPVRRILLYPLGGFSEIEREPPTPGREFLVSAAGPALSLALAAAGYGLMHVVPRGHHRRHPGPPAELGQPGGRDLQPAARPAAGRRPDAARGDLEADRPPVHRHHRGRLGRPGARRQPVRPPVRAQRR